MGMAISVKDYKARVDSLCNSIELQKTITSFLHLKNTVDDVVRMNTNEEADKPQVDKIAMQISEIKKGEIGMEQIKEELVEKLDYNHDGKTDGNDVKAFFKDWSIVIVGILIFSLSDAQNEIMQMIEAGSFNWAFLLKLVGTAAITSFFYLVKKAMDKEKVDLSNALEAAKNKINDMMSDVACMKLDHLLEIKNMENGHNIIKLQLEGALKMKDMELNRKV
jgi:hypothetical protein